MKPALAALVALATALSVACGTAGPPISSGGPPPATPRWTPAARIDDTARDEVGALLSVSLQGRVIAIRTGSRSGRGFVSPYGQRSSRYSDAGGWSAGEVLPFVFSQDLATSVAVDDEGKARAVGTVYVTGATRDDLGERVWWGSSGTDSVVAFVDGQGLALWTNRNGLFMSVREQDGTWTPESLGPSRGDLAFDVQLAMDGSGRAVALWQESDRDGGYPLFGASYDPHEGWTAARLIAALGFSERGTHQVVLDRAGRGVATWSKDGRLYGLTYDPRAGWAPAAQGFGTGGYAALATDRSGHVMATWPDQGAIWYSTLDLGGR